MKVQFMDLSRQETTPSQHNKHIRTIINNCQKRNAHRNYNIYIYNNIILVTICVPYLPVYKSIPCISRPLILKPKNKFFLFMWKNFLEKLLFYRRISFQIRYSFMKKTTASLDVKFTISLT